MYTVQCTLVYSTVGTRGLDLMDGPAYLENTRNRQIETDRKPLIHSYRQARGLQLLGNYVSTTKLKSEIATPTKQPGYDVLIRKQKRTELNRQEITFQLLY